MALKANIKKLLNVQGAIGNFQDNVQGAIGNFQDNIDQSTPRGGTKQFDPSLTSNATPGPQGPPPGPSTQGYFPSSQSVHNMGSAYNPPQQSSPPVNNAHTTPSSSFSNNTQSWTQPQSYGQASSPPQNNYTLSPTSYNGAWNAPSNPVAFSAPGYPPSNDPYGNPSFSTPALGPPNWQQSQTPNVPYPPQVPSGPFSQGQYPAPGMVYRANTAPPVVSVAPDRCPCGSPYSFDWG